MTNELYQEVWFVDEYRAETEAFYRQFFPSDKKMQEFFIRVFKMQLKEAGRTYSRAPRLMMDQVKRFISLANGIPDDQQGKDSLRVMFFRLCLESCWQLSGEGAIGHFLEEYIDCMPEEGRNYIRNHFLLDSIIQVSGEDGIEDPLGNKECITNIPFSIQDFFRLMDYVRNGLVQEGNTWDLQFFEGSDAYQSFTRFTTGKWILLAPNPVVKEIAADDSTERTYFFYSTMQYSVFMDYFVKGCINFICAYMEQLEACGREKKNTKKPQPLFKTQKHSVGWGTGNVH